LCYNWSKGISMIGAIVVGIIGSVQELIPAKPTGFPHDTFNESHQETAPEAICTFLDSGFF